MPQTPLPNRSVIALDPGTTESAIVYICSGQIVFREKLPNDLAADFLRSMIYERDIPPLAIEKIECYGMAVGESVFETCFWSGRFAEIWLANGGRVDRIGRKKCTKFLCPGMKASDKTVRAALIARFGGEDAIGKKASPGPLFGFAKDTWAALAVALTWFELYPEGRE